MLYALVQQQAWNEYVRIKNISGQPDSSPLVHILTGLMYWLDKWIFGESRLLLKTTVHMTVMVTKTVNECLTEYQAVKCPIYKVYITNCARFYAKTHTLSIVKQ